MTSEVKLLCSVNRSESEAEQAVELVGADAKPSDLRMSRVKWR